VPLPWGFTETYTAAGTWQVVFTAPGGSPTDVTVFRGAKTIIDSYSYLDPFGEGVATLKFPSITGYDDLEGPDLQRWLTEESNVDIYWVPAVAGTDLISPITGRKDLSYGTEQILWEGFVASLDIEETDTGSVLVVSCQGALLQADRYLSKPAFPPRPFTYEYMIRTELSPVRRPNMRTKGLRIAWPKGWKKRQPGGQTTRFTAVGAKPGENITGYSSRDTGSWDRAGTGFIQSLLAVMFTQEDSGVTPGNQWRLMNYPGRQPVLEVRDRFRDADFSFWYGQVGVKTGRLTRDSTQKANVYYGEGTGVDGTGWRNAVISNDGSRTDYAPLAWHPTVYPTQENQFYDKTRMVYETYQRFGSGFDQKSATGAAVKQLARDSDPGWVGQIVVSVDPTTLLSRWQIRAGMTMLLKGFMGTGETGMRFHIAEVTANPESGSVTLKVDTKFRDLLTLEEVIQRTRDPLTPSRMLQINKRTVLVEDVMAPWDYTAGSGFMPKRAKDMIHNAGAKGSLFPWTALAQQLPPKNYPQYYVRVKTGASSPNGRWAFFPILMSQAGTIRRIEMVAFDKNGNIDTTAEFHLSLYYANATLTYMPMSNGQHSAFFPGAFESTQPNGAPWPAGNFFGPDESYIVGWGNYENRAGYSPGSYAAGNPKTGKLVDEGGFSFNCTNNPNWIVSAKPGQKQPTSAITIHAAIYATSSNPNTYFLGRMFRQEPGT